MTDPALVAGSAKASRCQVTTPWNAPEPGVAPSMNGFVTDYISTFTGEVGRQPTYEE